MAFRGLVHLIMGAHNSAPFQLTYMFDSFMSPCQTLIIFYPNYPNILKLL